MIDLIFASNNDHKLSEAKIVLRDSNLHLKMMRDIGYTDEIIEDGDTLEENAKIKARIIHSKYDCNVISEDTGLEVESLNMEPGVYTARYAGPQKNHDANMDLVLDKLKNHSNRKARFRAVICLIWKNREYLFEGIVDGKIAESKSGIGGFGYDPIFIPNGHEESFAMLGDQIKAQLSHRAKAFLLLKEFIDHQK